MGCAVLLFCLTTALPGMAVASSSLLSKYQKEQMNRKFRERHEQYGDKNTIFVGMRLMQPFWTLYLLRIHPYGMQNCTAI